MRRNSWSVHPKFFDIIPKRIFRPWVLKSLRLHNKEFSFAFTEDIHDRSEIASAHGEEDITIWDDAVAGRLRDCITIRKSNRPYT